MIVTDKQYFMEKGLVEFSNIIAKRVTSDKLKLDYPVIIDGYEGYGKSNFAVGWAYYLASITGRTFGINNIFFLPDELIKFVSETENQVILWDESALAGLSMQHTNRIMVALIQLLMTARKKRHILIMCIPRFYRLKEPIIERCMGLVHVYARNEEEVGRFFLYNKEKYDALYETFKKTKRKPPYHNYASLHGSFPPALASIIDEAEYDKKKDIGIKSILSTLSKPKDKYKIKHDELLIKICKYAVDHGLVHEIGKSINKAQTSVYEYAQKDIKSVQFEADAPSFTPFQLPINVNKGLKGEVMDVTTEELNNG